MLVMWYEFLFKGKTNQIFNKNNIVNNLLKYICILNNINALLQLNITFQS